MSELFWKNILPNRKFFQYTAHQCVHEDGQPDIFAISFDDRCPEVPFYLNATYDFSGFLLEKSFSRIDFRGAPEKCRKRFFGYLGARKYIKFPAAKRRKFNPAALLEIFLRKFPDILGARGKIMHYAASLRAIPCGDASQEKIIVRIARH